MVIWCLATWYLYSELYLLGFALWGFRESGLIWFSSSPISSNILPPWLSSMIQSLFQELGSIGFTVTMGSQECDPASVLLCCLKACSILFWIEMSSKVCSSFLWPEDRHDRQEMLRTASVDEELIMEVGSLVT